MNVTLLKYDKDALDLLVMSKQTRLSFTPADLQAVRDWPEERKLAELNYMLGTIESSWEFADYMFLITDVSRAFTHQLVRSREGSYAQQSQRTVDMSGLQYLATGALSDAPEGQVRVLSTKDDPREGVHGDYDIMMGEIDSAYRELVARGVPPQDARGLLPTNVATAIIGKFNLRTLSHMAALRLCTRTQGEYQNVFQAMRARVVEVHPWAEPFLRVHCARHGVCAFPHYKECPIKGPIFNPDTGRRWDEATYGDAITDMLPATRTEIQDSWVQLQRAGGFQAKPKQMAPAPEDAPNPMGLAQSLGAVSG
jgi:thymidylate synthase (FAD)